MRKFLYFIFLFIFVQNLVFASATDDYREIIAKEALRKRYYDCIATAQSYVRGNFIMANINSCEQLGSKRCQKLKQDYELMINECEGKYGKYK